MDFATKMWYTISILDERRITIMELVLLPALTGATLASAVNGLFTMGVQFVPGVRVWWAGLKSEAKQTALLVLTAAVGLAYFGLGLVDPAALASAGLAVPPSNVMGLLLAFGGALASLPVGESIYQRLPEMRDVVEAKAARPE
jgi:hypothetical protein